MSSSQSSQSSSRGTEKVDRSMTPLGATFDDKPLWNHVKVLNVDEGGGGNRIWMCNYCNKRVVGSYTKVKCHLMKLPHHSVESCPSINDDVLKAIKKEYEEVETKKYQQVVNARKMENYVTKPNATDILQQKKRKGMIPQGPLPSAFNVADRDVADKKTARMFYASGLPFNFARSPYFRSTH